MKLPNIDGLKLKSTTYSLVSDGNLIIRDTCDICPLCGSDVNNSMYRFASATQEVEYGCDSCAVWIQALRQDRYTLFSINATEQCIVSMLIKDGSTTKEDTI